jgi:2-polyprenyl-3-methyl-5-hydroxy-6-metoxy-1,4-benzoquinol methylase
MNNCIICGGADEKKVLYGSILKCEECGHAFVNPQVYNDEELFRFYNDNYFSGNEYRDYVADKKIIQKNFKARLSVLQKFLNPSFHHRLLEIGCAYGFFLEIAKEYFNVVKGIDIAQDGIAYAHSQLNLEVICGDFLKHELSNERFDVVCMWDTIEHLSSPHLYIEKISKNLEINGLLALTTPDYGSLNARMRRKKWRFLKPPEHLHFFTKKSLATLLHRYGFEIIYYSHPGVYLGLDNIVYKIFVLHEKGPWVYKLLSKIHLNRVYLYINTFDIMFVIARKV